MSNLLGLRARTRSHIYILHRPRIVSYGTLSTPDMIYKSAALARGDSLRDCSEKCLLGQEFQHIPSKICQCAQFQKWMETKWVWEMSTGVDGCRQRNYNAPFVFWWANCVFGGPTLCMGSLLCVWGAYCVFGEPSAGLLGISPLLCDLLGWWCTFRCKVNLIVQSFIQ